MEFSVCFSNDGEHIVCSFVALFTSSSSNFHSAWEKVNNSLDTIKSIEAFNRNHDRFKGIISLIYGGFFLPKFNIHGLFHALMYIRGLSIYEIGSFEFNTCFLGGAILGFQDQLQSTKESGCYVSLYHPLVLFNVIHICGFEGWMGIQSKFVALVSQREQINVLI